MAWAHALRVVAGKPARLHHPLAHLWHPPQPRISRGVGSLESLALYRRYTQATTVGAITAILAEIHTKPATVPN